MKAIVQDRYGPAEVLQLRDIDRPAPKEDEVLVRVRATSVDPDVWHVTNGLPRVLRLMGSGVWRPKRQVPGTDVAGVVVAVGPSVTRFRVGDEVFGVTFRRMQWVNGGAYAEFATAPEEALALKPANVSFEEAATVPTSALIALLSLRAGGEIQADQKVLVNGAGGGVGTVALQIAKAFDAKVTAVDGTSKLELLRAIGADQVIDYTRDDFTRGDERYDLIFDIPGNHPWRACRRVLTPTGTYVLIGHDNYGRGMRRWVGLLPRMLSLMALSPFVSQLPEVGVPKRTTEESLVLIGELLETGRLKPCVDRIYPLAAAADAIRYLQEGTVKGKVVLRVSDV